MSKTLCKLGLAAAAALALSATPVWSAGLGLPDFLKPPARFASPEAAAAALEKAWAAGGDAQLIDIFGAGGRPVVISGDPVAEASGRRRMAQAYAVGHHLEAEGPDREVLVIGREAWPYPVPIVRRGGGWVFDVAAGKQQILDRRIGGNELLAIETCRAVVMAQREFAAGVGRGAFAAKVQSAPGAHDGLFWPVAAGAPESPLGARVAAAEAQGYGAASREGLAPFQGYFFRILTAQGRHAGGGARSYVKNGRMTGGFALIAWPAKWGDSGVMTFIVNQSGVVFERNLGPATPLLARRIETFDPDPGWRVTASH